MDGSSIRVCVCVHDQGELVDRDLRRGSSVQGGGMEEDLTVVRMTSSGRPDVDGNGGNRRWPPAMYVMKKTVMPSVQATPA